MPRAYRPRRWAVSSVTPVPQKGSSTVAGIGSPGHARYGVRLSVQGVRVGVDEINSPRVSGALGLSTEAPTNPAPPTTHVLPVL